jgi:hypothetical protein
MSNPDRLLLLIAVISALSSIPVSADIFQVLPSLSFIASSGIFLRFTFPFLGFLFGFFLCGTYRFTPRLLARGFDGVNTSVDEATIWCLS